MSSINAHRRAYLRCRRLLVIGWVAAFALSIPQAVIFRVFEPYADKDFRQCTPLWTTFLYEKIEEMNSTNLSDADKIQIEREIMGMQRLEKMYNINHLLFVFWIPCIIIVISYLTVLLILQGHLKEEYHGLPPMSTVSQIEEDSSKSSLKGKRSFLDTRPLKPTVVLRSTSPGAMAVSTIHKAKQVLYFFRT
ncbi:hypothetical protein ANCCAN_15745 [Ancylostoma caninum]|uniref:G-protein coupled receptors family 1 profile domain-containing protein n=1 Tax=Ancylostoma caninum TaxID=29170 RepID=A0A368G1T6_ANCCA|nr:hypothetical protein ANCCAN_15745 [Ancylostoma caninum]